MTHLNQPDKRLLYWSCFINSMGLKECAEVGVWKGLFAEHILRECPNVERYMMVDSWRHLPGWNKPFNVDDQEFKKVYLEAKNRTEFAASRRKILCGTTMETEKCIADESLDFVYIDGDHSLRGIVIDTLVMWRKLKAGGVLAGDDFTDEIWQHGHNYEPTLVNPFIVCFAEAVGCELHLPGENQFYLIKGKEGSQRGDVVKRKASLLDLLQRKQMRKTPTPRDRSGIPKALSTVKNRLLIAMKGWAKPLAIPDYIKSTGVLFVHVPKNAGSSISLSLYGRAIGHKTLSEWEKEYSPGEMRKLKKVAIVRDPIDRFISAFIFLKAGGMNQKDKQFATEELINYDTPDQFAKALIDPGLQTRILKQYHFRPQVEFITGSKGRLAIDILVPFEKVSDLPELLEKTVGKRLEIKHFNSSKQDAATLPLSAESIEIVSSIYHQDLTIHRSLTDQRWHA